MIDSSRMIGDWDRIDLEAQRYAKQQISVEGLKLVYQPKKTLEDDINVMSPKPHCRLTEPCRGSKNVWSNQSSVVQVDSHKLFHPSWHWGKGPWWNKGWEVGISNLHIGYDLTDDMTCLQICTYIHSSSIYMYIMYKHDMKAFFQRRCVM